MTFPACESKLAPSKLGSREHYQPQMPREIRPSFGAEMLNRGYADKQGGIFRHNKMQQLLSLPASPGIFK